MKDKKLSLIQAIPLGIGSILGSGVLFLPSSTFEVAQNDVLIAWIAMIAICIPGIYFFKEMVTNVSPEEGMAGFIELGLGKFVGDSVYVLIFGTVILGMPSAALIASEYLKEAFLLKAALIPFLCYMLILSGIVINLCGLKVGSAVTAVLSLGLLSLSLYLILKTFDAEIVVSNLSPSFKFSQFYPGMILSFWAFAGFENLTFLYHRFENPKRDLILTILFSIIFCGVIYLGLVMSYGIVAGGSTYNSHLGLLALATYTSQDGVREVVGLFAVGSVLINLVSWSAGVSRIIEGGVQKRVIPLNIQIGNKRALMILGGCFIVTTTLITFEFFPLDRVLELVSVNFILVYCLAFASYLIFSRSILKRTVAFLCLATLLLALLSTGYLLIYPIVLMLFSTFLSIKNETRILDDLS